MAATSSATDAPPPRPLIDRVRARLAGGGLDLPALAEGRTPERWRALADVARADVSEARLVEAHVDAVQILREAGRRPTDGAIYAVWASEHPRWTLTATPRARDCWELSGAKAFCTGAGLVDRALISLRPEQAGGGPGDESLLVDVDLKVFDEGRIDRSAWVTSALADTATAVVNLTGLQAGPDQVVGQPGWYLERPGFWDGAVGPAACWAGAAQGLVDAARAQPPTSAHSRAHLGALVALDWHLSSTLDSAGREIDARSGQADTDEARATALTVRHLIDVAGAEVQDRFARALGPRALTADPEIIARNDALLIYRRQCHAEADLQVLGDLRVSRDGSTKGG